MIRRAPLEQSAVPRGLGGGLCVGVCGAGNADDRSRALSPLRFRRVGPRLAVAGPRRRREWRWSRLDVGRIGLGLVARPGSLARLARRGLVFRFGRFGTRRPLGELGVALAARPHHALDGNRGAVCEVRCAGVAKYLAAEAAMMPPSQKVERQLARRACFAELVRHPKVARRNRHARGRRRGVKLGRALLEFFFVDGKLAHCFQRRRSARRRECGERVGVILERWRRKA
mmetsp:Transcript_21613/g.74376  ORF Transcript_21613/g.74376 Transcript_21613/m.74376 type:complete len:229 (-) Transcript_21613:139-825(-)